MTSLCSSLVLSFIGLSILTTASLAQEKVRPLSIEVVPNVGHAETTNRAILAFAPDGETVVSGGPDSTVKLWSTTSGKVLRTFTGHRGWVRAVAFSPNGRHVLSGSNDKTAKLWDAPTGQLVRTFAGHRDSVWAVAFFRDGSRAVSGSFDKTIKVWDVATGQSALTINDNSIDAIAISPDGARIPLAPTRT